MAEAIVNHRYSGRWKAASAGTHPAGSVHPQAIQALAEIGIEHRGRSKNVAEFRDTPFDRVITVCDSAAEECPVWLGRGIRVHESFPDPAKASGSEEEILAEFRKVRDAIIEKIPFLLGEQ
jgi:arsenate reductase